VFIFAIELLQGGVDGGCFHEGQAIRGGMVDGNGLVLRLNAVDIGDRQLFLCTLHHRLVVGNLLLVATPAAFGAVGELSCDIEVAVGIGDGTDDVVSEFARRFLSGVGFQPVEVLSMGGDCHQREERKTEGLSCHSCVVFVHLRIRFLNRALLGIWCLRRGCDFLSQPKASILSVHRVVSAGPTAHHV